MIAPLATAPRAAPDAAVEPQEGIAIIGMSCRFPGAAEPGALWRNAEQGGRARDLPELGEWFDAALFGISPREAAILDPQHRLLLECAWEALEHAGHAAEDGGEVVGVFAGSAAGDRRPLATAPATRGLDHFQRMLAVDPDYLPLRVSYRLGLTGPSFAVQAGAATSLVALHLACESLLAGEIDLALAGAVRIDVRSRRRAAANGAGMVVLRRLADALAGGDAIRAVVLGSAIDHGGRQRRRRGEDRAAGAVRVVAAALAGAGLTAARLGLLEIHAAGGRSGGGSRQLAALAGLPGWQDGGACAVGSVGAQLGDLDEAAGMAGLIRTVLALERRRLPASSSPARSRRRRSSPAAAPGTPLRCSERAAPWLGADGSRYAGVSVAAAGIANAALIVGEAPPAVAGGGVARACQLLPLSAASETALGEVAARLARHLGRRPEEALADVAYTLQMGRRTLRCRQALVCASREQALAALAAFAAAGGGAPRPQVAPELCFVLPGGGVPHLATLRGLWVGEPCWRLQLAACGPACQEVCGRSPRQLCEDAAGAGARGDVRRPALYVVEVALGRLLVEWGLRPAALAGEGIGELAGACLAGALPFEIGLDLAVRGRPLAAAPERFRAAAAAAAASHAPGKVGTVAVRVELGLTAGENGGGGAAWWSACDPAAAGEEPRHASNPGGEGLVSSRGGEGLMALAARLWMLGHAVRWPALYPTTAEAPPGGIGTPAGPRRRVSLPTYPFERRHYRSPGPDGAVSPAVGADRGANGTPKSGAAAAATAATAANAANANAGSEAAAAPGARPLLPAVSVRLPFWRLAPLDERSGRAAPRLAATAWLLVGAEEPLSGALARLLRGKGCEVVTVGAGKGFARLGPRRYQAAPSSGADFLQVLREVAGRAGPRLRIVHLGALSALGAAPPRDDGLVVGLGGLLALAEALGGSWGGEVSEVAVIAGGLYGVEAGEQPRPELAALLGACRLLSSLPAWGAPGAGGCRVVDLLAPAPGGEPAGRGARRLLAELCQPAPAAPVALRRARRWVRDEISLRRDTRDGAAAAAAARAAGGTACLVTGGLATTLAAAAGEPGGPLSPGLHVVPLGGEENGLRVALAVGLEPAAALALALQRWGAPRALIHTPAAAPFSRAAGSLAIDAACAADSLAAGSAGAADDSAGAVVMAVAGELRRLAALQAALAERPEIPLSLFSPAPPIDTGSSPAAAWATAAAFAAAARCRAAAGGWTQAVEGLPATIETLLEALATVRWPELTAGPAARH